MSIQDERVVLITGGSSGMGRAMAAAFVQVGAHVIILGRDAEKVEAVTRELGPTVTGYRADVSRREEVEAVVSAVVGQSGHIDVLINAAGFVRGVTTDMPLAEAEREWDAVLETNLKGSFLMTVALAPHLPRPGGRILYISSIAAFSGGSRAGSVAYAAAKSGLHGLTYGFARELSSQGITVNAIAPGFIAETGFTGDWPQERVCGIVAETPIGRAGRVEDIAAALYLASPEASFVTGEVLNVNGGWLFGH